MTKADQYFQVSTYRVVVKFTQSVPISHFISFKKRRKYNDNPAQPADSRAIASFWKLLFSMYFQFLLFCAQAIITLCNFDQKDIHVRKRVIYGTHSGSGCLIHNAHFTFS